MNVGHNSTRQMSLIFRSPSKAPRFANICLNCRESSRNYGSAAAAAATIEHDELLSDPLSLGDQSLASVEPSQLPYKVASAVVVSRPPVLTRDKTDFENAFYFYQRRLNERLALPFTPWFYYKKKTIAEAEYKKKHALAQKYNPYREGWKDELMVGDYRWKEHDLGYKRLVETTVTGEDATEAKGGTSLEGEVAEEVKRSLEKPLPRETEADRKNDKRSLNRKLSRTLYLLVNKRGESNSTYKWKFPQSDVIKPENLREAAMRTLDQSCGVNMNTWFVGNVPIGHYQYEFPKEYANPDRKYIGKKVFFMKCRILAGQADLENNTRDLEDFMWLTKEEIKEQVSGNYYGNVRHMLVSN